MIGATQELIPTASSEEWHIKPVLKLRKKVLNYYRTHYYDKTIYNKQMGLQIKMAATGGKKLSFGGGIYPNKACIVTILQSMIEQATYSNYKARKPTDKPNVVGYINFNVIVKIDEVEQYIHLTVRIHKDGKIYYNHEVNIYKK